MDQKRHMLWRTDARVRYSAAYPTGAERCEILNAETLSTQRVYIPQSSLTIPLL